MRVSISRRTSHSKWGEKQKTLCIVLVTGRVQMFFFMMQNMENASIFNCDKFQINCFWLLVAHTDLTVGHFFSIACARDKSVDRLNLVVSSNQRDIVCAWENTFIDFHPTAIVQFVSFSLSFSTATRNICEKERAVFFLCAKLDNFTGISHNLYLECVRIVQLSICDVHLWLRWNLWLKQVQLVIYFFFFLLRCIFSLSSFFVYLSTLFMPLYRIASRRQ